MKTFRRVFIITFIVLVVLAVAGLVTGQVLIRRSFPRTAGTVNIAGLNAAVDIYRDEYGIPQIYGANMHDIFFAQGYVHAQDRFWQMDVWRHIGSARLSEMFGEAQVDTDRFLRTLGWARVAQQELNTLDPDSRAILEVYTEGVNAYIAGHKGSKASLEYAILGLLSPSYTIEPWQPLHTLTWAKAMAWDLGGNMDEEIARALLLHDFTAEQVADLYPPYPENMPYILPDSARGQMEEAGGASLAGAGIPRPILESAARSFDLLTAVLGPAGVDIGSNSWTISGKLTATGKPLLANDPHLGAQIPSIWYEVGLHCAPKSPACPLDVTGFSFAGAPGIIIGHNDRIAWGFTNVGPDVQDLYIEKINPANPNQYEYNGQWVDMEIVNETINVAGGSPVDLEVRYTRHGPIISPMYGLGDFAAQAGIAVPSNYALSLRWTALEPGGTFTAIWRFNLAQNWEEFREAASVFTAPSQNLVYADIFGNIGYQTPGRIPIRARGDGTLPAPGWTDEYEWTGFIPFDELPHTFNPPEGYVATANNAVVGPEYPYLLTYDWDYGYRAQRIVNMIENAPGPIDADYIQKIQGDNYNAAAALLVPLVQKLPLSDARLEKARALFNGWDFQDHMDSAPAALANVFWANLLKTAFGDQLKDDFAPGGSSRWFLIVQTLLAKPTSPWWDDVTTAEVETRDVILARSFDAAVTEIEGLLGKDPSRWAWGDLHTLTFQNQTLGKSGVGPIEAIFNRGPFRTSGGSSIVNATGWSAASGYTVRSLPSMRMIVDLGDLAKSLTMHTTGQSGHAYHPHYIDMADPWRLIQYHPLLWTFDQTEAAAKAHLVLQP